MLATKVWRSGFSWLPFSPGILWPSEPSEGATPNRGFPLVQMRFTPNYWQDISKLGKFSTLFPPNFHI
jgi:hypothetical protein